MQMAGYLMLVAGLRKAGVPRLICLVSYAAMILHPGSFQLNSVTMTDNFYTAILPLTLGGLLLAFFTANLRHATWTGVALAVLWNTREESFLIPPMVIVFLFVALCRQRLVTRTWKSAAHYWLKPASAMLGTLLLLNSAVGAANYRAFHGFSKSEMTSSSYKAAFKAWLRIKPSHVQRFVPVSTEALETVYRVSPTLAQLKPQFEGELGRNWQVPTFATLVVHESDHGLCGRSAVSRMSRECTKTQRLLIASTEMWPGKSIARATRAGCQLDSCSPVFWIQVRSGTSDTCRNRL